MENNNDGNDVAFAFALTFAAGLATCIGGLVIFSKRMVYLANPISLTIALSASCGVMLYISLVEILNESKKGFQEGFEMDPLKRTSVMEGHASALSTLLFVVGIAIVYLLDLVVHWLAPSHHHSLDLGELTALRTSLMEDDKNMVQGGYTTPCFEQNEKEALSRTGMLTAIAIALHNLPEGIATYIAAIDDTRFGIALACGIALHNIPEGVAVAAPVYFATGSRWKGFKWTLISALAEPLGGILAWLMVGDEMSPFVSGILYGLVSGMMVGVCFKEMLPTARAYSKNKEHLIAYGVFSGMIVMASSLILFAYAGLDG